MTDIIGYAVIVEQADDGGYGAWSPDLPGCVGLGDTIEECLADMQEAIDLYVVLRERGDEVPQPRAVARILKSMLLTSVRAWPSTCRPRSLSRAFRMLVIRPGSA